MPYTWQVTATTTIVAPPQWHHDDHHRHPARPRVTSHTPSTWHLPCPVHVSPPMPRATSHPPSTWQAAGDAAAIIELPFSSLATCHLSLARGQPYLIDAVRTQVPTPPEISEPRADADADAAPASEATVEAKEAPAIPTVTNRVCSLSISALGPIQFADVPTIATKHLNLHVANLEGAVPPAPADASSNATWTLCAGVAIKPSSDGIVSAVMAISDAEIARSTRMHLIDDSDNSVTSIGALGFGGLRLTVGGAPTTKPPPPPPQNHRRRHHKTTSTTATKPPPPAAAVGRAPQQQLTRRWVPFDGRCEA